MKNIAAYYLLGTLLLTAGGCKKDQDTQGPYGTCAPQSQTVKTVTDVQGTVAFDATLQQYVIRRALPGTYDSEDIGVVCGTLPAGLQAVGTKVLFNGTYRAYSNPPQLGPVGAVYYYLELTKAAAK